MGRLERFLRLERARPHHEDAGGSGSLDRFREPLQVPGHAEAVPPYGPRSCLKCGAENSAVAPSCFNCDADLDTTDMRAHQKLERRRGVREAEQRGREAEELAEREIEKLRREREPGPSTLRGAAHPPFDFEAASPLLWMLRGLRVIEHPWYRFGARLAVIGAFVGLVGYAFSSPTRYPLFLLALLLLGGAVLRGGRWDRRR